MDFAILFVASFLTLGLEILLTRVFSVVMFASHSFLAISVTLLGTGIGALAAYRARADDPRSVRRVAAAALVLLGVLVVVSFWGLLQIEFLPRIVPGASTFNTRLSYFQAHPEALRPWKLYFAVALGLLPFLVGGYLQARVLRAAPARFGLLYGADLLGATAGSIALPLLLYPLGLTGVLGVCVLLAAALALVLSPPTRSWRSWGPVLPVLLMAALWGTGTFRVQHAAGFDEADTVREMWSPMSRVALQRSAADGRDMYVIDNASRTFYARDVPEDVQAYAQELYTIPFALRAGGSALIIASGGGQENVMAHHLGLTRILAVEIASPIVRDIVGRRKDEPGNPYLLSGLDYEIADGRSVAMRSRERWDVIEMTEVNFLTIAGLMSQAWSPYFVFSQEAFGEYLERLAPDGLLAYEVYAPALNAETGTAARRIRSMVAGMKAVGVSDPAPQVMVLDRHYGEGFRLSTMVKRSPYTADDLRRIRELARERGARILFPPQPTDPGSPAAPLDPSEVRFAAAVGDMIRDTRPIDGPFDTMFRRDLGREPINDDRPFLTGSGLVDARLPDERMIGWLYRNLLAVLGLILLSFLGLPAWLARRSGSKLAADPRLLGIVGLTGVGFMLVEMAGIYRYQLYLEHPTVAMMVILSGMILGAGFGSLHSHRIAAPTAQRALVRYAAASTLGVCAVSLAGPMVLHRVLLALPMVGVAPLVFALFAALGFLLGHVVPLTMAAFAREQGPVLAWSWSLTVTGSVLGTVLGSILSRDFGMFLVALLGVAAYALVVPLALGRGAEPTA